MNGCLHIRKCWFNPGCADYGKSTPVLNKAGKIAYTETSVGYFLRQCADCEILLDQYSDPQVPLTEDLFEKYIEAVDDRDKKMLRELFQSRNVETT